MIGNFFKAKKTGLTFVELILVAILILVVAGLSLPLFRRPFRNIQLKNTCQELVQLMRYAQAKSIAERRLYRINFDFEQGAFWPTEQREDVSGDKFKNIPGRWGKLNKAPEGISIKAPEGISVDGESAFITFYPDGSSDKIKIEISNVAGKKFIVTAQRNISYVQSEE